MLNLTIKMIFNHGSYVVHAEVNAILNTNHASAAGQVSLSALLCHHAICSSFFFGGMHSVHLFKEFTGLMLFSSLAETICHHVPMQ
jgi:hypothetical protein